MAATVKFNDFTAEAIKDFDKKAQIFLQEATIEVEAAAKRMTPAKETQLKGSWNHVIDSAAREGKVGSPLQNALWNEFGTGSYAEFGNGRKGWWVYVEGNGPSSTTSKTYPDEKEAKKAARFLQSQGLDAHPSNGKEPQKTLRNAYAKTKSKIIARARAIFGGKA